MTSPEILLWERLKRRTDGLVFKRQVGIGPYVLDFFCYRAQLAIEVDGAHHSEAEQAVKDQRRDIYLQGLGILTYRLAASDVLRHVDGVADGVRLLALERAKSGSKKPHHPAHEECARSPSPTGGEE